MMHKAPRNWDLKPVERAIEGYDRDEFFGQLDKEKLGRAVKKEDYAEDMKNRRRKSMEEVYKATNIDDIGTFNSISFKLPMNILEEDTEENSRKIKQYVGLAIEILDEWYLIVPSLNKVVNLDITLEKSTGFAIVNDYYNSPKFTAKSSIDILNGMYKLISELKDLDLLYKLKVKNPDNATIDIKIDTKIANIVKSQKKIVDATYDAKLFVKEKLKEFTVMEIAISKQFLVENYTTEVEDMESNTVNYSGVAMLETYIGEMVVYIIETGRFYPISKLKGHAKFKKLGVCLYRDKMDKRDLESLYNMQKAMVEQSKLIKKANYMEEEDFYEELEKVKENCKNSFYKLPYLV